MCPLEVGGLETSSRGYPNSMAVRMAAVYEGEESAEKNVFVELLQPQDGENENGGDHSYNKWTILLLDVLLNRRNLSKTGRKQEPIYRVVEHDENRSSPWSGEELQWFISHL